MRPNQLFYVFCKMIAKFGFSTDCDSDDDDDDDDDDNGDDT